MQKLRFCHSRKNTYINNVFCICICPLIKMVYTHIYVFLVPQTFIEFMQRSIVAVYRCIITGKFQTGLNAKLKMIVIKFIKCILARLVYYSIYIETI